MVIRGGRKWADYDGRDRAVAKAARRDAAHRGRKRSDRVVTKMLEMFGSGPAEGWTVRLCATGADDRTIRH
jgi:hypothetical protein